MLIPALFCSSHSPFPQSELNEWLINPPEGCRLLQFEPLTLWVIEIAGPDTSPSQTNPRGGEGSPLYQGQFFKLRIAFTERYPLEPPEFIFLEPVPVHPHIYSYVVYFVISLSHTHTLSHTNNLSLSNKQKRTYLFRYLLRR